MGQVSEIKCPVCGKWSEWTGKIDEKCPHCLVHLDPGRFHYAEAKKLVAKTNLKNSYLIVSETDDPIVAMGKQFIHWLKWTTFYGISVAFFIIGALMILFGLAFLV